MKIMRNFKTRKITENGDMQVEKKGKQKAMEMYRKMKLTEDGEIWTENGHRKER